MNSENVSNHSRTKIFGKLSFKLRLADAMPFFSFALYLILGDKFGVCGRDDLQRTSLPFAQWKYGEPTYTAVYWSCYGPRVILLLLHNNGRTGNPETDKRLTLCDTRVVQSKAQLLISYRKDQTGKRKFKSAWSSQNVRGPQKILSRAACSSPLL